MAVLSKEDFFARIKARIGDDTSDDAIQFVEDITDTFNELSENNGSEWKNKYDENDAAWRKKYKERFFSTGEKVKEEQEENVQEDSKDKTFEELFEKKEG